MKALRRAFVGTCPVQGLGLKGDVLPAPLSSSSLGRAPQLTVLSSPVG